MRPRRHLASCTLLFVALVLLAGGLAAVWKPSAKEYHGTIYYADHSGIWKVQLPSLQKTRLAGQDLLDPLMLQLSPDEEWLAYLDGGRWSLVEPTYALWVLSTQAGTPVQVDADVRLGAFLPPHQLLYQDQGEQAPFLFDPQTRTRQPAERWRRAFGSCDRWFSPTGREELLESCPPHKPLRGCLRVVDLEGRHPLTITEPFFSDQVQWSRDGERVLFRDGARDSSKLYVWNRRDGTQRQVIGEVSHQGYEFWGLSWSPDGQWATFVSGWDWYAVEVTTGRVVPFGPIVPIDPAYREVWSPDSRGILTPLTPAGQSEARWTGKPMAFEYRLSIVGIPEGDIVTLTSGDDFPRTFTWGSK